MKLRSPPVHMALAGQEDDPRLQAPEIAPGGRVGEIPRPPALRALKEYVACFLGAVPHTTLGAASLLVLAAALSEGASLALLAPLVMLLEGQRQGFAARILAATGAPLSLPLLVLVFVAVVALRAVLLRQRDLAIIRLRYGFIETLRRRLCRAVAYAEWRFLARERLSDITKALTADVERIGQGTFFFLRVPANLGMALFQLAIAFHLAPGLTLGTLCVAGLLMAVMRRHLGIAYVGGGEAAASNRAIYAEIAQLLDGMKLSKSHNLEARHVAAFDDVVEKQRARGVAVYARTSRARMSVQIAAGAALGIYVLVAAEFAHLSLPSLLVTTAIFARLLPLISDLQQSMQNVLAMLPTFNEWHGVALRAERAAEALGADGAGRIALAHDVRLSGVSFRYEKDRAESALTDVDVIIPAGSITAIVGPSGAGKTTLADLVMGLIAPDRGEVQIDGRPLGEIGVAAWRRSIAYVPQENFLFHDTVRQNLLWAAPDANEGDIESALARAAADRFVARLPLGLDTIVGERGIRLSGGERQRLALARALLRRPTLLVLDEATSALDGETENAIIDAIEGLRGTLTVLVIAHRLSTIRNADQIVVIDGGRAVQSGRWDELSRAATGRFAGLLRTGAAGDPPGRS